MIQVIALAAFGLFSFGGTWGPTHRVPLCHPVHDGTSHRDSIQNCLDARRVTKLPCGTWEVHERYNSASLLIRNPDRKLLGSGPCTVIKLQRPDDGFSQARIIAVSKSHAVIDRLHIDGGQGAQTCEEAKYREDSDGGVLSQYQGQQQHAIMVGAAAGEEASGLRLGSGLTFSGVSGDAIYLYARTTDMTIRDTQIGGYCRSGLTMNTSGGVILDNILVDGVDFVPSSVAQVSARGIDIEPNSLVSNVTIRNTRASRMELGRIDGLTLENVSIERMGNIDPWGAAVSGYDITIRNSYFRAHQDRDGARTALQVNGDNVLIEDSTLDAPYSRTNYPVLSFTGSLDRTGPMAVSRTSIVGDQSWGISYTGATEPLTLHDVTISNAYGVYVFGPTTLSLTDSYFDVDHIAVSLRSALGATISDLDGDSATAVTSSPPVAVAWCNNPITGTVSSLAVCP